PPSCVSAAASRGQPRAIVGSRSGAREDASCVHREATASAANGQREIAAAIGAVQCAPSAAATRRRTTTLDRAKLWCSA
ncbi:hypothetical protein Dimus_015395, partial [Dionaea muscipula]